MINLNIKRIYLLIVLVYAGILNKHTGTDGPLKHASNLGLYRYFIFNLISTKINLIQI